MGRLNNDCADQANARKNKYPRKDRLEKREKGGRGKGRNDGKIRSEVEERKKSGFHPHVQMR